MIVFTSGTVFEFERMFFDVDFSHAGEGVEGAGVEVLGHGLGKRFHSAAFGVPELCVGAERTVGLGDGPFDGGFDGRGEDAVGDPVVGHFVLWISPYFPVEWEEELFGDS